MLLNFKIFICVSIPDPRDRVSGAYVSFYDFHGALVCRDSLKEFIAKKAYNPLCGYDKVAGRRAT